MKLRSLRIAHDPKAKRANRAKPVRSGVRPSCVHTESLPVSLLIFDVETYYDSEYSLRKMTTPAYILDPRFELQMVAVKLDDGPHEIIDGQDFPAYLAKLDPKTTTTVAFNALFDNSILAWRYGFVPGMMLDAMGMARALRGHLLDRFSLEKVAEHLELGVKGTALQNMMGKRAAAIKSEGLWPAFCDYAIQDNILCEGIFNRLLPEFPRSEWRVMDLVLRCCVEPSFVCDADMLRGHLDQVRWDKAQLLNNCSIDQIKLMSAPKFKVALEERGVVVKMKTSKATGKETPAFAKTDDFMAELAEHDDVEVQAMAAARVGLKSTLEETRTEKLLGIAGLPWPSECNMPMPLRYGAAHTHRLGGDWGMNVQNMPADRKKDGKSKLRASLKTPPGNKVIVGDLGQIECRIAAWLAGAEILRGQFANKQDPYAGLATEIFGRPINRKVDIIEGFIGKTGILGLGYGCGKDRFYTMCMQSARMMGLDYEKITRELTDAAVDTYRKLHWQLPALWRKLDGVLGSAWLYGNEERVLAGGAVRFRRGTVVLPNGMELRYAEPKYDDEQYTYRYGRERHYLYGAKLLENVTQALARIVVMDAARRLYAKGLRFVLQSHDELVFICREGDIADSTQIIRDEMTRAPVWAPDLPLTADVNSGYSYSEAK